MPTIKRAFDLAVIIAALIIASPLLIIVAVLAKMSLGSPVLFRQQRRASVESLLFFINSGL